MEIKALDFFLGLSLGGALGVGLTLLARRLRSWFGVSETSRLRSENQALKRRLSQKDKHISRMIKETERLAERLGQRQVEKDKLRGGPGEENSPALPSSTPPNPR